MKNVPEAVKPLWREKLKEYNKLVREAVEIAKAKWVSARAEKLNQMNVDPKEGWRMAREITQRSRTELHAKAIL